MKKVMILASVALLSLTGCGASSLSTSGTMLLKSEGVTRSNDADCQGYGDYDAVRQGAQVMIKADGATVGKGELVEPKAIKQANGLYQCLFSFSVSDIKGGSDFYSVQIADRSIGEYTEKELVKGLSLSLGSY